MKTIQALKQLDACIHKFDAEGLSLKQQSLSHLAKGRLPAGKELIHYYHLLLFLAAYPADTRQQASVEKEFRRISSLLRSGAKKTKQFFANSGLPFTDMVHRFSHDAVRWLLKHRHGHAALDSISTKAMDLNEVLRITLPSLEKSETLAGMDANELMDALKVPAHKRLHFLVQQLSVLDTWPGVKDLLFDHSGIYTRFQPSQKTFSLAHNRLPQKSLFFHNELLKTFDIYSMLDMPVPAPQQLTSIEKDEAIRVIKNSLALTVRETDPVTYLDPTSFRIYELERGITIAIYSMVPERQLPLECYVGYTAFKNGMPVAYGGGWVFGERSLFGINIFKPYRKGESAYLMAELLRVYRQVFRVNYFEVEAYQFGLDNPEGIRSGAFWFYYRFGFRPLQPGLRQLAKAEMKKKNEKKTYKTPARTLLRFTESPVALNLGQNVPMKVGDITNRVITMIRKKYNGDRQLAEKACVEKFLNHVKLRGYTTEAENQVLRETGLWAEAMNIQDPERLRLMAAMIEAKPKDIYLDQDLLLRFFHITN